MKDEIKRSSAAVTLFILLGMTALTTLSPYAQDLVTKGMISSSGLILKDRLLKSSILYILSDVRGHEFPLVSYLGIHEEWEAEVR